MRVHDEGTSLTRFLLTFILMPSNIFGHLGPFASVPGAEGGKIVTELSFKFQVVPFELSDIPYPLR